MEREKGEVLYGIDFGRYMFNVCASGFGVFFRVEVLGKAVNTSLICNSICITFCGRVIGRGEKYILYFYFNMFI